VSRQEKPPSPAERSAAATERIAAVLDELTELNQRRDARAEMQRREWEAEKLRRESRGHQSEPRRLSFLTMARALPALAEIFSRKIPGAAWAIEDDGVASVACPCGNTPEARQGVPVECGGEDCNRHYLFDGEYVRVGYPDTFVPARQQEPQTPAAS
jgi:hypothetical protein